MLMMIYGFLQDLITIQSLNYVEELSLRPATLREAPCSLKLLEHSAHHQ
jgi:hypothetical protein